MKKTVNLLKSSYNSRKHHEYENLLVNEFPIK